MVEKVSVGTIRSGVTNPEALDDGPVQYRRRHQETRPDSTSESSRPYRPTSVLTPG